MLDDRSQVDPAARGGAEPTLLQGRAARPRRTSPSPTRTAGSGAAGCAGGRCAARGCPPTRRRGAAPEALGRAVEPVDRPGRPRPRRRPAALRQARRAPPRSLRSGRRTAARPVRAGAPGGVRGGRAASSRTPNASTRTGRPRRCGRCRWWPGPCGGSWSTAVPELPALLVDGEWVAAQRAAGAEDPSPHPLLEPDWIDPTRPWAAQGRTGVEWYLADPEHRTRSPHPLFALATLDEQLPSAREHPLGPLGAWLEHVGSSPRRRLPGRPGRRADAGSAARAGAVGAAGRRAPGPDPRRSAWCCGRAGRRAAPSTGCVGR